MVVFFNFQLLIISIKIKLCSATLIKICSSWSLKIFWYLLCRWGHVDFKKRQFYFFLSSLHVLYYFFLLGSLVQCWRKVWGVDILAFSLIVGGRIQSLSIKYDVSWRIFADILLSGWEACAAHERRITETGSILSLCTWEGVSHLSGPKASLF